MAGPFVRKVSWRLTDIMIHGQDTETTGKLYRSEGYAENIPAASTWEITSRGEFILQTDYEALSAEETFMVRDPNPEHAFVLNIPFIFALLTLCLCSSRPPIFA